MGAHGRQGATSMERRRTCREEVTECKPFPSSMKRGQKTGTYPADVEGESELALCSQRERPGQRSRLHQD